MRSQPSAPTSSVRGVAHRATGRGRSGARARVVLVVIAAITSLVVVGCAVGPDTGPGFVAGDGGGDAIAASTSTAPAPAPALQAPTSDLTWTDCASSRAADYATGVPQGVSVECAELPSAINPDRPQTKLTIALTRLRLAQTPRDAAPLVLTSGTDLPSARAALLLASGPGRALLTTHPVVAVDRRGVAPSTAVDCLTRADRATLADNGLAPTGSGRDQRITALAAAASSAADGCTETLSPDQLAFGARNAAADLEALRQRWNVPALGLIGVGEGSDIVLAYSALYGGRSGRIILDTPTAFGASSRDKGAATATGVQAALTTFAQRCAALGPSCALGADGVAAMTRVLTKGRSGTLGGISDTQALAAITTALALAPNSAEGLSSVADAIAGADRGATGPLAALVATADKLRLSDGQLVGTCNDVSGPVSQNDIGNLAAAWAKQNPLTGTNTALSLLRCNSWAASEAIAAPATFPVAPLVLNTGGDPLNGGNGAAALDAVFTRASTTPTVVSWDGLGYSVLARSSCAAEVVSRYVASAPLEGPQERGCPA